MNPDAKKGCLKFILSLLYFSRTESTQITQGNYCSSVTFISRRRAATLSFINILKNDTTMPRYFCDYCQMYLTHDSQSARRQHNYGWKHRDAFRLHYAKLMRDPRYVPSAPPPAPEPAAIPSYLPGMELPPGFKPPPPGPHPLGLPPLGIPVFSSTDTIRAPQISSEEHEAMTNYAIARQEWVARSSYVAPRGASSSVRGGNRPSDRSHSTRRR